MELSKERKIEGYSPTEIEAKNISYIAKRLEDMRIQRYKVDKNWPLYQKMIDATYETYGDERSSSVVPLISSMIEMYVAEARKLMTEFNFKGEGDNKSKAKALEFVWKKDFRDNKRKRIFIEDEYICAGFGTSIIYSGVEKTYKTRNDPIFLLDGTYSWEKVNIEELSIISKNIDLRKFYLDDRATCIEDANDCILIDYISIDKLLQFEGNSLYKNLEYVVDNSINTTNDFIIDGDNENGRYVKLTYYWNLDKDYFVIIANDKVIIREHYIIDTINGRKGLPFTVRGFGKKSFSIYHRGFCEAGMMFNSEINNLREMLMDAIRRSNSQTLLLGNGLTFNGREFSYNNEILNFQGQLNGNFQQISGNAPNQAIFAYLDRLYKDIAVFIGIDIQNMIGQPQQTAFQTEVQREAMQKRVNIWLENRDLAYERFADLHKDLLQKYYIYTLGYNGTEESIPELQIEGGKFDNNGNYKQQKGTSNFKLNPEMIRGNMMIDVYTNTTAPTINAVDRAQKLELINSIGQFTQGYMLAKQAGEDIESILPFRKTLEELANDFNITIENNTGSQDLQQKKAEFLQKLQTMKQGGIVQGQNLPINQEQGNI